MIYYGLLLFFVLEYVRPNNYIPALSVLHLNSLIPIAVVVGTTFRKGSVTNQDVWREPSTKLLLFLMTLIVLSILTADVTLYAFNVFKTVVGYVLVYWVLAKEMTDLRRVKGVLKTLIFVHLVVAALTPEIFTNPEVRHYMASGAFLGDGNDFALSVNLVIPFCLFLLLDASTIRHKLIYAGALLLLVLGVVGTSSRGGTVALAAMGLYYWLKSDRKFLMAVISAAIVGLILAFAPPLYFERMQTIKGFQDGSAQGRILAWKAGVLMAVDHPFLGVGAGHFPVKYGVEYRPKGFGATEIPWQTAHSVYFVILGELGFPGLGFILALIGSNLVANRRLAREIPSRDSEQTATETRLLACLSASLIAFAVGGAFLTAIYYPHVYVLAGLMVAARRLIREGSRTLETAAPSLEDTTAAFPVSAR